MVNLIQPITVQQAYDGITHARQWASWNWWWRMVDDDSNGFPSPEPRTDSRSALPREIRAWQRLRIVKRDETFSLIFFSPWNGIYRVGVEVGGAPGGPRDRGRAQGEGARPPPSWTGCGPPRLDSFASIFIFSKSYLRVFSGHSKNFCCMHNKQHHGSSAENSVSPG